MIGIEELWRVGRKQGRKRPTRRATLNTRGRIARSGDRIGTGQPSCGLPLTVWAVDKGATCRCRIVRAKFACRTKNRARFDDGVVVTVEVAETVRLTGQANKIVRRDGIAGRRNQTTQDVTGKILFAATNARQRRFTDFCVSGIDRRCFARCCQIVVDCHGTRLTSGVI
jgi:hypothetical protein